MSVSDPRIEESVAVMGEVTDEQRVELAEWATRIDEHTQFDRGAAADACYRLGADGFDAEETIRSIGPIAAYADVVADPLPETAHRIAECMAVYDIEAPNLPWLLDMFEATANDHPVATLPMLTTVAELGALAQLREHTLADLLDAIGTLAEQGLDDEQLRTEIRMRLEVPAHGLPGDTQ